jgi:DNA-binding NtrC family response regulator
MSELKIVLLEDDAAHARLIMAELKSAGLEFVPKVVSTQEQLELALSEFQPDLILSDFYLPNFDGLLALSICRTKSPEVPFVFVTGVLGEELAIETLKHGATDYVLKTHLSRLIPAVRRALREAEDRAYKKRLDQLVRDELAVIQNDISKDLSKIIGEAATLLDDHLKACGKSPDELESCFLKLSAVKERITSLIARLQTIEKNLNQLK